MVISIPFTTLGKVMAICIAYLGVGAVAIPTGIISAGFVEQYQRKSGLSNIKNADIKEIAEILADRRYAGKTDRRNRNGRPADYLPDPQG